MSKKLTREEKCGVMSECGECLTKREILTLLNEGRGRVYFIGVGGVSMRSLFCLCRHFGIKASGSDRRGEPLINSLIESGEDIVIGEREALPEDTSLIVYSHAIEKGHGEREAGRRAGIPEISRDRLLGALMECYEERIGVSGSHGKSTVTSMIGEIFQEAGKAPTVLSGACLRGSRLPFKIGSLDYLIYEGCEYKDSFLSFSPTLGVFLNIELDHTDYFKDIEALSDSFCRAMRGAGKLLINADDPRLLSLALRSGVRTVTYGMAAFADYSCEVVSAKPGALSFKVFYKGLSLGEMTLPMLGEFNISNAMAAIGASMEMGVDFHTAKGVLSKFSGIERRLERIGEYRGRGVYYDYAHHPTEIRESVRAVRGEGGKVTVIFRPHTYSRTEGLWEGFVSSLSTADHVILLDIDGVREKNISGVTSLALSSAIGGVYCDDDSKLHDLLDHTEGDIIVMGAASLDGVRALLVGN